tara:strand:+ start:128 stop:451 length:324 start_codon:yes stop_codon:yes gene_type:complete
MKFEELITENKKPNRLTHKILKFGFTRSHKVDSSQVYNNKDGSYISLELEPSPGEPEVILTVYAGQKLYNLMPDKSNEFNIKKTKFDGYVEFKSAEEVSKYLNKHGI